MTTEPFRLDLASGDAIRVWADDSENVWFLALLWTAYDEQRSVSARLTDAEFDRLCLANPRIAAVMEAWHAWSNERNIDDSAQAFDDLVTAFEPLRAAQEGGER